MADQSLPDVVARLRSTFRTGRTKSLDWRLSQLQALKKLMLEGRNDLCEGLKRDLGKSAMEGWVTECNLIEAEIQTFLDNLSSWMKPEPRQTNLLNQPATSYVHREPLGVALIMGAWNYPVMLTLMPLVGSIAAGNCAVIKVPSDKYSPASSSAMAKLIKQYLDPDCFDVVEGGREAITAVLEQRWDVIFFTGGAHLGKMVASAAAKHLTPTLLELGGQNPCIVDKTACVDLAARRITWGSLMNCGQTCLRPEYIFVHEAIEEEFVARVKHYISQFYSEEPQKSEWFGRLPNDVAWKRISDIVKTDKQFLFHGGGVDQADRYVAPSVLRFPSLQEYAQSACAQEEIFGPIVPIVKYKDLDAAITHIADREKPLALYVFTDDKRVEQRVLSETSSGGFGVNDVVMHCVNLDLPFGGVGHSGMGAYHGRYSFECFSHRRAVLAKPNVSILDAPVRYPPYDSVKSALLKFVQEPRPYWAMYLPTMVVSTAVSAAGILATPLTLAKQTVRSLSG